MYFNIFEVVKLISFLDAYLKTVSLQLKQSWVVFCFNRKLLPEELVAFWMLIQKLLRDPEVASQSVSNKTSQSLVAD